MSHEIYYTSAPEGLKCGTTGFCTVAASENIPKALWDRLETLSAYRHQFAAGAGGGQPNPVSFAHWILNISGKNAPRAVVHLRFGRRSHPADQRLRPPPRGRARGARGRAGRTGLDAPGRRDGPVLGRQGRPPAAGTLALRRRRRASASVTAGPPPRAMRAGAAIWRTCSPGCLPGRCAFFCTGSRGPAAARGGDRAAASRGPMERDLQHVFHEHANDRHMPGAAAWRAPRRRIRPGYAAGGRFWI